MGEVVGLHQAPMTLRQMFEELSLTVGADTPLRNIVVLLNMPSGPMRVRSGGSENTLAVVLGLMRCAEHSMLESIYQS